jgi:signal peptidase I
MLLASTTAAVAGVVLLVLLLSAGLVTALKAKWESLAVGLIGVLVWIVAAVRLARPESWWAGRFYGDAKLERARARETSTRYRALVVAALVLSLAVLPALYGLFDFYRIPSSGMETTLRCAQPEPGCSSDASDRVLALRYLAGSEPERGDIVVFRRPTETASICPGPGAVFVKRLIGLPGDEVELRDRLFVNGAPLDEHYLNGGPVGQPFGPVTVPEGEYFLMGDNRDQSCDSREFGTVPRESITSRVVAIYWPLARVGTP